MLNEVIEKKLVEAKYKVLKDGSYFGEIPGLGVWAASRNLEDCRMELREVVQDWLFLKVRDCEPVRGFKTKTDRRYKRRRAPRDGGKNLTATLVASWGLIGMGAGGASCQ